VIGPFKNEYQFLSNFFPYPVKFEGIFYHTVEHAYQAAKTLDINIRRKFDSILSPSKAKKFGRRIDLRQDWEEVKLKVMETCLRDKFRPGTLLAQKLLDTGDEELIEVNWWGDRFWGTYNGIGENHLGKLLMKIRNDLHKQAFMRKEGNAL